MQRHTFSLRIGIASLLVVAGLLGVIRPINVYAGEQSTFRAYEVVQFGGGDTIVREIGFDAASIPAIEALTLSGLAIVTRDAPGGAYVCSIEGVGDCTETASNYWGYYRWDTASGAWVVSPTAASSAALSEGAVEGWVYLNAGFSGEPALPSASRARAVPAAIAWIQAQQNSSTGGYGNAGGSAEALLAIGSDGYLASRWIAQSGSPSLGAYWMANGASYARKGGDSSGKLAVGLRSGSACWLATAPHPAAFYDTSSGAYASGAGPQSWAILGSLALGESVPTAAVTNLKDMVQSSGGWEWQPGFGSDTNTTALVVQALLASGEAPDASLVVNALAYLKNLQQDDGGIAYDSSPWTTGSDADSSAYAIMAIQAAGQDPTASAWSKNEKNPVVYLLDLQLPGGGFEWQKGFGANALATGQAITALLGNDYLPKGGALSQCPAVYLPAIQK